MWKKAYSLCTIFFVGCLILVLFLPHAQASQRDSSLMQVIRFYSSAQRGTVEVQEFSLSLATGEVLVFHTQEDRIRQAGLPQLATPTPTPESSLPSLDEAPPVLTHPTEPALPPEEPAFVPPAPGMTPGEQPGEGPVNPLLVPPTTPDAPPPPIPDEPLVVWKKYDLFQAFGFSQFVTGTIDYPATWLINQDIYNKVVSFSEDQSGLVMLTLFPSISGEFTTAQEVIHYMMQLLQYNVSNLSITHQDYSSDPQASQVGMSRTKGRVILEGSYQGTPLTFIMHGYAFYAGVGNLGFGQAILCQVPSALSHEKTQEYFNRMIASYEKSLGYDIF